MNIVRCYANISNSSEDDWDVLAYPKELTMKIFDRPNGVPKRQDKG